MPISSDEIAAFWLLFREHANELAAAESAESPVYNQLLDQLQKVNPGLYLEFCSEINESELIVTADGDQGLFPIAREIVAAAPAIDGWSIRALKPKLGFPETTAWEGLTVEIDGIVFDPLELEGSGLGLRIFVPGLEENDVNAAHNAVLRALDHALGEEKFAEKVRSTKVYPLPADGTASDYIPIHDLEKFIDWRVVRRKNAG